jgi:SOS response regulatory protein OraA/RecX
MPTFYAEDLDIDVDEFLFTCNYQEIDKVIEWLREEEYISNYRKTETETESINDSTFNDAVIKIQNHRISLSREEEEFILNIAKRF